MFLASFEFRFSALLRCRGPPGHPRYSSRVNAVASIDLVSEAVPFPE